MTSHGGTAGGIPAGAQALSLPDGSQDLIVREEALVLNVDGVVLTTMRTPQGEQSDIDWAVGFLAGEGVIRDISDIRSITLEPALKVERLDGKSLDNTVRPEILPADVVNVKLRQSNAVERIGALTRAHEIRASCGICGVADAATLLRFAPPLKSNTPQLTREQVIDCVRALRMRQPLFDATGGCHGTAITSPSGVPYAVAEDIGRHNALDKVIGQCLRDGRNVSESIAVLSGRAGYELVAKCLRAGVPVMLAVGAASTFGCDLAQAANATLVGFIRYGDASRPVRMNIYTDAGRIVER